MKSRHRQALKNLLKNPNMSSKPIHIDQKLLNLPPLDLSTDIFDAFHEFYIVYEDHHQKNNFSEQDKENKPDRANNNNTKKSWPLHLKNSVNKSNRLSYFAERTQIASQSPNKKKHKSLKSKKKDSTVSIKSGRPKQQTNKIIKGNSISCLFSFNRKSLSKKNKISR